MILSIAGQNDLCCAKKSDLVMEKEKIDKMIEFLEDVFKRPAMHFGKVDSVERANSFLVGIRYATFSLFDLDRYSIVDFQGDVVTKRGHRFSARGVSQELKDEGYEDIQIVKELIEIEIDFWKLVRNSLHK